MRLLKLELDQFRNYSRLELEFKPDQPITYIVGPNAQGKTNILEAIYLLALTKSFRTSRQQDLIGWGQDFSRVKGIFAINEDLIGQVGQTTKPIYAQSGTAFSPGQLQLEVFFGVPPQPKKSLKKNNVKVSSPNFIGNCQIVFFHPEDLNMLYLGPDLRRRYLDILNLQINRNYFSALRSFKQILKQRNALLREINNGFAPKSELEVWDEQLAENGSILILERAKTVAFINKFINEYYQKIAQSQDFVEIFYKNAILGSFLPKMENGLNKTGNNTQSVHVHTLDTQDAHFDDPAMARRHTSQQTENLDLNTIKSAYFSILQQTQNADLKAEITTVGPHRDDLEITLNSRPLSSHASRGEYRSLLLSLKLLELRFFQEQSGQMPLLLLDDVFSELDLYRQKMLLEAIQDHQAIITTTHLDEIIENNPITSFIKINAGKVTKS